MSILANTKVLKSKYISILGFNILLNALQTLMELMFQDVYEGAHRFIHICPENYPKPAKVLKSLCLGIFSKRIVTLTAREFWGLKQSIRKRPDTRKRPDYHYDHCSDQGVQENVLGFSNVSDDKGYNQRDTDCLRQNSGDLHEGLHEGNSGRNTDIPKPEAEGEDKPNDPYPKSQNRENQNNADYIAHPSIVGSFLPNLNKRITLTAREFLGIESECLRLIEEIQVRPRASHQNDHRADESIPEYRTGPLEVPDYESDREGDTNCLGYLYDHTMNVISPRPKKPVGTTSPNKKLQAPQYREAQNNADCNDHNLIVRVCTLNLNYGVTPTAREFLGKLENPAGRRLDNSPLHVV